MVLTDIFTTILKMSLTASVVILAVCLARFVLKKAPKIYSYMLWALVLFRLLCPVSVLSSFSVIPDQISSGEAVSEWSDDYIGDIQIYHDNRAEYEAAVEAGREPVSAEEGHYYVVTGSDGISEPKTIENTIMPQLSIVWAVGVAAMILYSVVSYARIRKQIKVAVPFRKNIYIADDVASPFVMGLFRPVIYLPGTLERSEQKYIICHERHHIRRGDHIFKALGFLALIIHWFNPLVWLAFVLAGRDMEMSCDEAVIRKLGEDVRAEYSASLLNLATGQRLFAGTPLAFGEGDPTGRVRNLAKWKKPAFWVVLVCVVLCVVLTICLMTDPSSMHLYEIDDSRNYSDIFTNTENITLIREGEEFPVYDTESLLELLDEVLVRELPVSRSRSEDRDKTNRIRLRDKLYLNFSWNYSRVWIDNLVKPTFSYRVSNPDKVREIFATFAVSQGVAGSTEPSENADWGVSLVPERVSRTGATAIFVYPAALPGQEDTELYYGDFLSLERMEDGKWVEVEEQPGYEYYVGDSSYPVMDGYGMVHEWEVRFGELPDGHYRMGKLVTLKHPDGTSEESVFYGEFFLPDSLLTVPIPLEELPEKYGAEQAMLDGCVVMRDGDVHHNQNAWEEFLENVRAGNSAYVRYAAYDYSPDHTGAAGSVYDIYYDGTQYRIEGMYRGEKYEKKYKYLLEFSGEAENESLGYDSYIRYVLSNEEYRTWEEVSAMAVNGSVKSESLPHLVYADLIYRPMELQLPANIEQVVLEFGGEPLVTITDFDRLEKIYLLFDNAELLGYEPKTHSIGVGLDLVLTSASGETMTIELDPDDDLCRINGEFVFYGAPDEPSYIEKLWYYLGIEEWPERVYEMCPNAYRP